jgi:uncharacterized membrane protein (DUF373 family)
MALALMMSLVIFLSTIELSWIILKDIITPPVFLLDINELLDIFGLFLLVLIGIELLYTIKTYAIENVIHAEVVLTVAMIAIGRKVIILDIKELSGLRLIGIGVIIIALSVGYYYFKKTLLMKTQGN